jgi:asparagine synthase (glutamine-hydrolysing)
MDAAHFGDRMHKGANLLGIDSPEQLYWVLNSHWKDPVVCGASSRVLDTAFAERQLQTPELLDRMCFADAISYLPDDILVKVDRASMAVSLESRVPLLDHDIVEFAWRLPRSFKVRNRETKWILRQVLYQYVPRPLIERPKMGFGVPLADWLRGPLRDWAEELLSPDRLRNEGFLDPEPIVTKWREHLKGERHWHYYLWNVLMFQAWLELENERSAAAALVH